jgi:hypothetical protein
VLASSGELAIADKLVISVGHNVERDWTLGEQNRSAIDVYRLIHPLWFVPAMVELFPDSFDGFRSMNVSVPDGNFPPAVSRIEKTALLAFNHKSFDFS